MSPGTEDTNPFIWEIARPGCDRKGAWLPAKVRVNLDFDARGDCGSVMILVRVPYDEAMTVGAMNDSIMDAARTVMAEASERLAHARSGPYRALGA